MYAKCVDTDTTVCISNIIMKLVWLSLLFACAIAAPSALHHSIIEDASRDLPIREKLPNLLNKMKNRMKKSTDPVGCYTVSEHQREPYTLCSDGETVAAAATPPHLVDGVYDRLATPAYEGIDQITFQGLHTRVSGDQMLSPSMSPETRVLYPQLSYQEGYYPLSSGYANTRSEVPYRLRGGFSGPLNNPYRATGNRGNDIWMGTVRRQLERTFSSGNLEVDYPESEAVDNMIPTLPLPGGHQFRGASQVPSFGVYPNGIRGGCGGIPLMASCSLSIVRGTLVPSKFYGGYRRLGDWGTSYRGMYLSPWMNGFGHGCEGGAVEANESKLVKKVSHLDFETSDKNTVKSPEVSNTTTVVDEK